MEKRIIWKTDEGGVAVFVPAPENTMPLDEVAKQVVPKLGDADRPYQIVDVTEIPSNRTFRDAWEIA
jgi:hypothetical protein